MRISRENIPEYKFKFLGKKIYIDKTASCSKGNEFKTQINILTVANEKYRPER